MITAKRTTGQVSNQERKKRVGKTDRRYIHTAINPLEDKDFMAELDKRSREMKSGKVKTYTPEETKNMAWKKVQSKKVA
jgi:hypothetical protein